MFSPAKDRSDTVWGDLDPGNHGVSAAKVNVLHLEPIKGKLGTRWPRLSELVHRLFERALKRAQGPEDHFVLVGELSYIVTFQGLPQAEAIFACASISLNVCELLFGNGVEGISIRSLVGSVPFSLAGPTINRQRVSESLERDGTETVITPECLPIKGDYNRVQAKSENIQSTQWLLGSNCGFVPMWDLASRKSNSVFLSARLTPADKRALSVRRLLSGSSEQEITNGEISLFVAAAGYARQVNASINTGLIGVGVSYDTLSQFHSRIRYITALKTITANPFLIKIEHVPLGEPMTRLAEVIAMMSLQNIRVLVEFESGDLTPDIDVRLGAHGIGMIAPSNSSANTMKRIAKSVAEQCVRQKAVPFVNGLDSASLLDSAMAHVWFGFGAAVTGSLYFSENEGVPQFPLTRKAKLEWVPIGASPRQ
jgi:hypothetical protein